MRVTARSAAIAVLLAAAARTLEAAPAAAPVPAGVKAPPAAEHRVLVNLARSAVGDAFFDLQRSFDGRAASWNDWAIGVAKGKEGLIEPVATRESLRENPGHASRYEVEDVRVVPVRPVPEGAAFGLVDFKATVRVLAPEAGTLTLVERHTLDLTDGLGLFPGGGRSVEISPTAVTTTLEAGVPSLDAPGSPEEVALTMTHGDMVQAVRKRKADTNASIRVGRTRTQIVVAEPGPAVEVSGYLVAYRPSPSGGAFRLERRLASGTSELPGTYAAIEFGLFDGAGGPFARITLRPAPASKDGPAAVPLTALVRAAGPEMLDSDIYDWSFMNALGGVAFLKPGE